MLKNKDKANSGNVNRLTDFSYLDNTNIYLDNACQTLRPQCVINAMTDYYQNYNACGGRVKYQWGQKVDKSIDETRELVLKYLGLSSREYTFSLTF